MQLREITDFCKRHRIAETRFSRDAVNDPRLIHDMRNGRTLRASTIARIKAYMAKYE